MKIPSNTTPAADTIAPALASNSRYRGIVEPLSIEADKNTSSSNNNDYNCTILCCLKDLSHQ
jgi:hypothetical protein